MNNQINNLQKEINTLDQRLTTVKNEKERIARTLAISENNLQALQNEAKKIKSEWDQKTRLKANEQDVYWRKALARDCSSLGTIHSARTIRVSDEKARIRESKNELKQKAVEISNLISLISKKISELSNLECMLRNQSVNSYRSSFN